MHRQVSGELAKKKKPASSKLEIGPRKTRFCLWKQRAPRKKAKQKIKQGSQFAFGSLKEAEEVRQVDGLGNRQLFGQVLSTSGKNGASHAQNYTGFPQEDVGKVVSACFCCGTLNFTSSPVPLKQHEPWTSGKFDRTLCVSVSARQRIRLFDSASCILDCTPHLLLWSMPRRVHCCGAHGSSSYLFCPRMPAPAAPTPALQEAKYWGPPNKVLPNSPGFLSVMPAYIREFRVENTTIKQATYATVGKPLVGHSKL